MHSSNPHSKKMSSQQYTIDDLNSAIHGMRWDEVRRIIRDRVKFVNKRYLGLTYLHMIVLAKAPQTLVLKFLEFATEEVIDDVNLKMAGRSILYYLASYGYVDALRRALEISQKRVNWQTESGDTPLHVLLQINHSFRIHLNAMIVILDAGADSKMKNQKGLTPIDVYVQNKCEEYGNTNVEKQKEEIMHLLYSIAVPGVVLTRGKEALNVFNKELKKGQITVNHTHVIVTGVLGGTVKKKMTDVIKKIIEEEPTAGGIVYTADFITEVNEGTYGSVAKKRKRQLQNQTSITAESSPTEDANMLEPMEGVHHSRGRFQKVHINGANKVEMNGLQPIAPGLVNDSAQMSKSVYVSSKPTRASQRSHRKRKSHLPSSVETEHSEGLEPVEKEQTGAIVNGDITGTWDFSVCQRHYTNPMYLKSEAVYLIGFNLMEKMDAKKKCRVSRMGKVSMTYDMTNIQIIKYHMELIFTYAVQYEHQRLKTKKPKILVCGTNSEGLTGNHTQKMKKIAKQFQRIFQEIKGTPYECYVVRKMYSIDKQSSSRNEMLIMLKQDISGFLKVMPNTIPTTWHTFQSRLQDWGGLAVHVPYGEVCKVAIQCDISEENLIHTMNYVHDLGIALYFKQNKLLEDTVVINPWKLDNITEKLITAVKTDDEMVQLWDKFDEEGILEEDLIKHIWREELSKDENNIEVFLKVMKHFGLLCEQTKNENTTHRSFFVPCRLKYSGEEMTITPDNDRTVSIYMTSDGFLLDSMFHCIVVRLIEMVQAKGYTTAPKLFYNKATIDLGQDHTLSLGQVIIDNKPSVKLEISRKSQDDNPADTREPSPNVCIQVLEYLEKELKALTSRMKHTSYMFRVLCWSDKADHFHNMEECLKNVKIRCMKEFLQTSKIQKLFKNMTDGDHVYLADSDLWRISNGMRLEWKHLGVRLGLKWNRINQIWINCCKQQPYCTFAMLTEWRSLKTYETNQVKTMGKALKDCGHTDLANSLFASQRNVKSDEKNTVQTTNRRQQDGYLEDIDMLYIANELKGDDSKQLGIHLAIKDDELNRIMFDFQSSIVDASLEMLVRWRDKQENTNHLEMMKNALNKIGRFDVTMGLEKN